MFLLSLLLNKITGINYYLLTNHLFADFGRQWHRWILSTIFNEIKTIVIIHPCTNSLSTLIYIYIKIRKKKIDKKEEQSKAFCSLLETNTLIYSILIFNWPLVVLNRQYLPLGKPDTIHKFLDFTGGNYNNKFFNFISFY